MSLLYIIARNILKYFVSDVKKEYYVIVFFKCRKYYFIKKKRELNYTNSIIIVLICILHTIFKRYLHLFS